MLLTHIERHLKATRTPPARFGRDCLGDPRFVFQLRDGRQPRETTCRRVLAYLAQSERGEAK